MAARILAAGAVYFAAVFAAGFALGVLRTLLLTPAVGPVVAVVVELPIVLGLSWIVCARILRRRPLSAAEAIGMGGVAFALLMLAEAGLSTLMAGRSLSQHLALYAEAHHRLGLAGQVAFAAVPWLQARRRHEPSSQRTR